MSSKLTIGSKTESEANAEIIEESESEAYITKLLEQCPVVVFGKTLCPITHEIKEILRKNNVKFEVIMLNSQPFTENDVDLIKQKLCITSLPCIFVGQICIGGCQDLKQALVTGFLFEYLDDIYTENFEYDLAVIGGGPAGSEAAEKAAKFDRRVALCDYVDPSPQGTSWGLGGTDVNVGSIPVQFFYTAGLIGVYLKETQSSEPKTFNIEHKWPVLIELLQKFIKQSNEECKEKLRLNGIDYYNIKATIESAHVINLNDEVKISARNIIIAVGSRPKYPDFPGAKEFCITSDDIFSLSYHPGKTLIIGGSCVAFELAGLLSMLNINCTIMVRSTMLQDFDSEIVGRIKQHMEIIGIKFLLNCVPTEVTKSQEGSPPVLKILAQFEDETVFEDEFNTIILATGRVACTENLGLENLGIVFNSDNGKIMVNEYDQTTNKTTFAIGDAADGHGRGSAAIAKKSAQLLVKRLYSCSKKLVFMDYENQPVALYTTLQYGGVGLSEDKARLKYPVVKVFYNKLEPTSRISSIYDHLPVLKRVLAYIKMVCAEDCEGILRVVGLHLLGYDAPKTIDPYYFVVKHLISVNMFRQMVGIELTNSEALANINFDP